MIDLAFKPGRGVNAIKAAFFDREAVAAAVSRGRRRALSRSGGLVRRIARNSMRKRRRASRPGEPPSVRSGELRRLLFFSYEPAAETVIVGPAAFARRTGAPKALEFGGRQPRPRYWRGSGPVRIAPRPFMAPAMRTASPSIPAFFANAIR